MPIRATPDHPQWTNFSQGSVQKPGRQDWHRLQSHQHSSAKGGDPPTHAEFRKLTPPCGPRPTRPQHRPTVEARLHPGGSTHCFDVKGKQETTSFFLSCPVVALRRSCVRDASPAGCLGTEFPLEPHDHRPQCRAWALRKVSPVQRGYCTSQYTRVLLAARGGGCAVLPRRHPWLLMGLGWCESGKLDHAHLASWGFTVARNASHQSLCDRLKTDLMGLRRPKI